MRTLIFFGALAIVIVIGKWIGPKVRDIIRDNPDDHLEREEDYTRQENHNKWGF